MAKIKTRTSGNVRITSDGDNNIDLGSRSGMPRYVGATAKVERIENGVKIILTDYEGTTEANVYEAIQNIIKNVDTSLTFVMPDGRTFTTDPLKGEQGIQGVQGIQGETGVGIESIELTETSGREKTYTITFTDATTFDFIVTDGEQGIQGERGPQGIQGIQGERGIQGIQGETGPQGSQGIQGVKGDTGNGIVSITKTATAGLVDTYTILYTDGATSTFNVTNGANGSGSVADVWVNGESVLDGDTAKVTVPVPLIGTTETITPTQVLNALQAGRTIQITHTATDENESTMTFVASYFNYNPDFGLIMSNGLISAFGINSFELAGWISNDYWELHSTRLAEYSNIPSKTSDLTNDTGFITSESDPIFQASAASGITAANILAWNNKSDFSGNYNDLTNKPTIPTVPTNVSAFNNDAGYLTSFTETDPTVPSWAKASSKPTYTASEVGAQPTLVSGTNIKTINNQSLLGSGDITLASSGTSVPTANEVAEFDSTAHMNSTDMTASEVTDFVDTLDAQGANLADFVVEQGTEGDWTYRKWNSGIAECWYPWSSGSFAPATAVGGFYGRVVGSFNFPTDLFVATPQAFFNLYSWGSGYFWGQVRLTTATGLSLAVWRNDNASSVGNGSIYAIGKWK